MIRSGQFILRWRGRETGPFSLPVIRQKLADHEIGLSCDIQCDGRWITLEEFFEVRARQEKAGVPRALADGRRMLERGLKSTANRPADTAPATDQPAQSAPPSAAGAGIPAAHSRRRIVFALFGMLLGFLGAHNFYAGYTRIGALQAVITVVAVMFGFGLIITWVWALGEVLFVHADARGAPLA